MPEVGDLVRITACSNVLGQQACNVFYYLVGLWTGAMSIVEVLEQFQDDVLSIPQNIISTQVTPATLTWANVDNPAEIVSITGGFDGNHAATPLVATFAAYPIRQYGLTAITRSGWKRIPGVAEEYIASGEITAPAIVELQAFGDLALAGVMQFPNIVAPTVELAAVIVGRNPDGTLDEARVNIADSATPQPRMSTQNSRKIGRGS